VRDAAQGAAPEDEAVGCELQQEAPSDFQRVRAEEARLQENPPTPAPVHSRRRPVQPHRITVGDAEGGEERGERVADQRGVEVIESPGSVDDSGQDGREDRALRRRNPPFLPTHPIRALLRCDTISAIFGATNCFIGRAAGG
jgi:hypothetical protein